MTESKQTSERMLEMILVLLYVLWRSLQLSIYCLSIKCDQELFYI